ncbi:MAG: hypothetical protein ACRDYU_12960, partial [Actinomycetes bacterium]
GLLGVLAAAGLLAVASGLHRVRRWARAPAVVTQLLLLPVSVSMVQGDQYAAGLPLGALAAVGLVLLLSPPTSRALEDGSADG